MKTDNELIAEFMGEEIELINTVWYMPKHITHEGERIECHNYLRYDTSWDWLMPVVEKIANIDTRKFEGDLMAIARYESVTKRTVSESIDVVYRATVEFINWYNTQSKG